MPRQLLSAYPSSVDRYDEMFDAGRVPRAQWYAERCDNIARLVGADASHAWASVFCPGTGWIDFDPTNDLVLDDEHITLAWGRDFTDVVPMRGVILGGAAQELRVQVTVTRMDTPATQWRQQSQGAPLP